MEPHAPSRATTNWLMGAGCISGHEAVHRVSETAGVEGESAVLNSLRMGPRTTILRPERQGKRASKLADLWARGAEWSTVPVCHRLKVGFSCPRQSNGPASIHGAPCADQDDVAAAVGRRCRGSHQTAPVKPPEGAGEAVTRAALRRVPK